MMMWPWRRQTRSTLDLLPMSADGVLRVGLFEDGSPAELTLRNQSGVVVGGVPGSGKTAGMTVVALALLRAGAHLRIIDGKGGDDWGWCAPAATNFARDDIDSVHEMLLSIQTAMRRRLASMRTDYGASNYWNVPAAERPPLEVVIIDECQTFFDAKSVLGDKEAKQKAAEITAIATDLVKKGRSAGYLVFVMTQKPTADSIPTALRDNCGVRICFRVATIEAAKAVLGDVPDGSPSPVDIPRSRVGGAVIGRDDGTLAMCRFAYIAENDATRIAGTL